MLRRLSLYLLYIYQRYVRIILPCTCRFVPSCSEYTKLAIKKYGFFKGALKGAKRVLHCHPFSKRQGFDPLT